MMPYWHPEDTVRAAKEIFPGDDDDPVIAAKRREYYQESIQDHLQHTPSDVAQTEEIITRATVARLLRKDERFYFSYNMDFRGRCYPTSQHFNHTQTDLSRGILTFADSRVLGVRGLFWLKVHLANVYGKDKMSYEDRAMWVDDNMHNVVHSASNPMICRPLKQVDPRFCDEWRGPTAAAYALRKHFKEKFEEGMGVTYSMKPGGYDTEDFPWWGEADSPWQALAACRELALAYNHPEGPEAPVVVEIAI